MLVKIINGKSNIDQPSTLKIIKPEKCLAHPRLRKIAASSHIHPETQPERLSRRTGMTGQTDNEPKADKFIPSTVFVLKTNQIVLQHVLPTLCALIVQKIYSWTLVGVMALKMKSWKNKRTMNEIIFK